MAGAAQGAGWHPPDRSLSEPTPLLEISRVGPQGQRWQCRGELRGFNSPQRHFLPCVGAELFLPSLGCWTLVWLPIS